MLAGSGQPSLSVLVKDVSVVHDHYWKFQHPGNLVEEPRAGYESLPARGSGHFAVVVRRGEQPVEVCLGECSACFVGSVDAQQDGLLRERRGPGLAAEPLDDVTIASPDVHQSPAAVWLEGVPQIARERVDINAGVVAGLGRLSLMLGSPDFHDLGCLIVGPALQLARVGFQVCPRVQGQRRGFQDRPELPRYLEGDCGAVGRLPSSNALVARS